MTTHAIQRPRKSLGRRFQIEVTKNRYIYLMILPVLAYFIIFKYWPMYYLRIAFYDYKLLLGFEGSRFVGWQNFTTFIGGLNFGRVVWNTVALNLLSLLFMFPLNILLALMLNEVSSSKIKRTVQTITYMPHFISTVILVSMITSILSPSTGILGAIAKALGKEPYYFLGDPDMFRGINVVSGIWQTTGWNSIVYLSAITSIDPTLYEAATVDGAGRFRRIWHVTLPGIRTTILIMLILRIGNMLDSNMEKVLLLQNDLNASVSETLGTYVYKMGIGKSKYGFSTAVGVFNSVVSLILVLMANFASRKLSRDENATVL